eukprot:256002-Pyramimonas_sp.AAC.1
MRGARACVLPVCRALVGASAPLNFRARGWPRAGRGAPAAGAFAPLVSLCGCPRLPLLLRAPRFAP